MSLRKLSNGTRRHHAPYTDRRPGNVGSGRSGNPSRRRTRSVSGAANASRATVGYCIAVTVSGPALTNCLRYPATLTT